MYIVKLKKNEEKKVLNGFPWIYANEVSKVTGKDIQGSVCRVVTIEDTFVGYGFINHASKIFVRMLTLEEEEINDEFFYKRLVKSNNYRIDLGYKDNYRVVFSESDLLPGLIVDKYGEYLSVQFLSLGMDIRKDLLVKYLIQIFNPKGIYERSDVSVREKEGLKPFKGLIYGSIEDKVIIEENGLKLYVDIVNGQKTGYFLDQKENRKNIMNYCKNKEVLDCFCNVGGFSLCASKAGAKKVTSIDISEKALELVRENAKLNNLTNIETLQGDVFAKLREYKANNQKFDCIILDPPAFTKSVDTINEGYKGYVDINTLALRLLNKNGYLITCSCSQHITLPLFMRMIEDSIHHCKVNAKLIEIKFQSKDHATLINLPESLYLKVGIITVL